MDSKQLVDSLADHMALFHRAMAKNHVKSQFRSNVIQWMRSLTPHQRQAALTIVDEAWIAVLLQMNRRLRKDGAGFFIILPDMVDRTQAGKNLELPSVCYRKARGLLARVSAADEAEKSLVDSVRLFSSGESQNLLELAAFDALVMTETFVSDVDKFVSVMDNVSTGEFLRSSNPSGSQWEEMPWLKARGYHSLAAFVANRLEICIGLSWLNSRGKKNGARLAAGSSRNLAMSTFWRKKGVIDWWCNVPADTKAGALKLALARAARLEAHQSGLQMGREVTFADSRFPRSYVRNTPKIFIRDDNDMCYSYFKYPRGQFCKNPLFEVLYNLQDISPLTLLDIVLIPESDRLFLSTLHCVDTVADKIIRRIRELIAKVSKDSLELDLLREDLQDPIHCPIDKGVRIQKKEKRRKGRKTKKKNLTNDKLTEKDSLKQTAPKPISRNQSFCISGSPKSKGMTEIKESLQFKMHKGEIDSCRNKSEPVTQREILILEINDGQVNHTSNRKRRSKSKKKLSKDAGDSSLLRRNGSVSEYLNDEFHEKPASCHEPEAVCSKDQILENRCHAMHEKEFSCAEISCGVYAENAKMSCNVNGNDSGEEHKMTCSTEQVSKGPLINSNSCDILEASINKCPPETTETVLNSVKLPCKALEALPFESNECSAGRDSLSIKGSNLSVDHRTSIVVGSISDIDCDAKQAGRVTLSSSEMPHSNTKNEARYEGLNTSINYTSSFVKPNADKMTTPGPLASPLSKTREGFQSKECSNTQLCYAAHDPNNVFLPMSYEWPGALSFRFPIASNRVLPAATDRLHLDVDWNYYRPQGSFVSLKQHWHRHSLCHGGYNQGAVISPPLKNFEWSKVHSGCGRQPSVCCSVDRGPNPIYRPSYIPVPIDLQTNANLKNDLKHDVTDDMSCDEGNDLCGNADDIENFAVSEDETEKVLYKNPSNFDYNKVFGGGVMYWNTADYAGSGYSRPPSLSSEDSSWARHEDDLKLAIDDIVSLPQISSPYGNSGVSSPTKTFCSPFDQYNSSTPASHPSFAKASNDISGNFLSPSGPSILEEKESKSIISSDFKHVDGCKGDMFSHPILRPIVIPNMTRQKSRTDVKNTLESRSSCMSSGQKEPSRLNRPPSPMVLCVPPHPLSPVRGFRKQRRFPAVRSGSSSPRHWVINSWFSETETDIDENCFTASHPELAGVSRRNKYITGTPPMPTPRGSLVDGRLVKIPKLPLEHEHPDIGLPLQSPEIEKNSSLQTSVVKLQNILHEEIECFCKKITSANQGRKPFINAAVDKVSKALQVLWPRSRTRVFGSISTGLALPTSDVDLVVCLPPVRNLEPIKEAGILEGRNGIKETCLQHAARYLADQEWVETDSLKTVENTTIPIIMLVVRVPSNMSDTNIDAAATHTLRKEFSKENDEGNLISDLGKISVHDSAQINDSESGNLLQDLRNNFEFVRLDISFESVSHTGLKTASLVRELTGLFPALMPLALVLKQFLTDRCLDHPYSGGLSSYCLVLLLTRFLQHQHHSGRSINQNLGSLLMDFLYFFGCVFDPRQMRVSIYGSGMYVNRGRGQSIDPLHIDDPLDDPLHPIKNVGQNCFRIHQCIKAFADAHSTLEKELHLLDSPDLDSSFDSRILPKIIPSIFHHDKDQR